MAPEDLLRARLAGTYGLSGQLHTAGPVLPPILLLGAVAILVPEGQYLASAFSVATGLFLTRLGWVAGLMYDRSAPKTPNLRMLDAGRPWVDLTILVLASALLVWHVVGAVSAGLLSEAVVIAAMAVLAVTGASVAARSVLRRRASGR